MEEIDILVNALAAQALLEKALEVIVDGAKEVLVGNIGNSDRKIEIAQRLQSLSHQYAQVAGIEME